MNSKMIELGIDKLSVEERVDLVHDLWDSIGINQQDGPSSDAMIQLNIVNMSQDERIELAMESWNSAVNDGFMPKLTDELKELLDRRCAEMDAHPENNLTLEEILASIEANR